MARTRPVHHAAILGGALAALALPASAQQAAQNGSVERSTLRGVYTVEQAARGETVFRNVCSNCHPASDFSGAGFQTKWGGGALLPLVEQIRSSMPLDNPGGLSAAEYASVVAYILKLNSYPAGDSEVPTDDASLLEIRFERIPPRQ